MPERVPHTMFRPEPVPAPFVPQVLLVDDDPRMLGSLELLLDGRGYALHSAAGGQAAIGMLGRQSFHVVLLDLHMPEVSGQAVMDFVRRQCPGVAVIVTSGAGEIDAAIGAIQRGAFGYLRKPYPREELLLTLENALQQCRLRAENQRIAQRLERSEKMYRYLVDRSPDIIYTLNARGQIVFINYRVQPLLGFRREELIGRHFSVLVHAEDMERAHYAFNEGRGQQQNPRNIELRLKTRHGDADVRSFSIELVRIHLGGKQEMQGLDGAQHSRLGTYGVARDITERKRADEQISYQAHYDILTDLPNRALFRDRLGLALLQAGRNQHSVAVMFIDLDRFKVVNDSFGHAAGDDLLQQVALRLKDCLRRCDTLSRIGGDEFTAVLPELGNSQDAALIADKFVHCLRQPFVLAGQALHISASMGVALYPDDAQAPDELVRRADMAMYHMKSRGKNGYAFFSADIVDSSLQKIALEHDLHLALERRQLEMYYQPQIDVRTQRIVGAEALMRWNHPQRGLLGAAEFLPLAEESGLMTALSDWMLEAICRDLLEWNALGAQRPRLSFNISPQYLERGDFFEKLRSALARHQIAPTQIEVEITENICIHNPQSAIAQLERLCQIGVSVAIDDFGTGYSSLSYLHRFPIHTIKIDRSFVMEIQEPDRPYPVVQAIVAIASGLGLNLVAEGVETAEQARYLGAAGCHLMQGFLYHLPLPQAQLLQLLFAQVSSPSLARG